MIILYVLLGILGILLLVLLIPVIISIKFREELELEIRLLFFYKKKLELDMEDTTDEEAKKPTIKPKKKKKATSTEEEKPESEKKSKLPEIKFTEIMSMISSALENVSKHMGELLRRFLIYDVELYMAVCDEDSAQTAIKTGQYNAWIYGIYGLLCNLFRTKNVTIGIQADFLGEDTRIDLSAKIRFVPLLVLITALKIAGGLLIIFIKGILTKPKNNEKKKVTERKGGVANEPSN